MAIGAIVQARTTSARLPGKVLRKVDDKALLAYVVERVARATLIDDVVVATSDSASDDPIASLCRAAGFDCHRGALEDVAGRILDAVRARGFDAFVRISGDSPLIDQSVVDRGVALLNDTGSELATNVHPTRTFPRGQSVEAFRTEAFERGYAMTADPADREHVTPVFYRHAGDFAIASFTHDPPLGDLTLTVDTEADLAAFTQVVGAMTRPHWNYDLEDVVELHRACVA